MMIVSVNKKYWMSFFVLTLGSFVFAGQQEDVSNVKNLISLEEGLVKQGDDVVQQQATTFKDACGKLWNNLKQKQVVIPLAVAGSLLVGGLTCRALLLSRRPIVVPGRSDEESSCPFGVCPEEISMVSLSTPGREGFASITEKNQREYAQKQGYRFVKYTRSLCDGRPEEWSKILAMKEQAQASNAKWLLWIDDDIIITNESHKLEHLIEAYGADKDLIIAQDADRQRTPINNGIFLLKNTEWSRNFLSEVWVEGARRGYLVRGQCLLEQQTMADLIKENPSYRDHVVILPQRTMNSFVRSPFMYQNDPEDSKWQFGDFAARATGWNGDYENRRRVIEMLADQRCQKTQNPSYSNQEECYAELRTRARVGH